jgi:O-antigen/teichoic acid export membrane protein
MDVVGISPYRRIRAELPGRVAALRDRPVVAAAGGTLGVRIVANAVSFVQLTVLARILGATNYGAYAYAVAWAAILAVPATLGWERYLVRAVATYDLRQQWRLLRGVIWTAATTTVVSSLAVGAIAGVTGASLLHPPLRDPFLLGLVLIPFVSLTTVRQGAMQGLRRQVQGQFPGFVLRPLVLLLLVVVVRIARGKAPSTSDVLLLAIAAAVVALVVGSALLVRAVPTEARAVPRAVQTAEWLHGALPMMLLASIGVVNVYVVTVALGSITGAAAAGEYNVIARVSEGLLVLSVAINASIAPQIARLHAQGQSHQIQKLVSKAARVGLLWTVPVGVFLMVLSHPVLGVFGPAYEKAAGAFAILIVAQTLNVLLGPAGTLLLMTGHERTAARCFGIGTALNVLLALVLIPLWGLTGGALSSAISVSVIAATLTLSARRRLGITALGFEVGRHRDTPESGGRP